MDIGEQTITILSLLLLCITGVFGIPSNAYLLYKAFRNPTVLLRNIIYFIPTGISLVACCLLIPLHVVQRVWVSHKGSINPYLCTASLSISAFVELSLLFNLSVLTVTRSTSVQSLRIRSNRNRMERPLSACGPVLGLVGFIYIWSSTYGSKTWNEASNMCIIDPEEHSVSLISYFFVFRLLMLICTCMVMLGSWISLLKFLYYPKVTPVVPRYNTDLPQIEVIFDQSLQDASDVGKADKKDGTQKVKDTNTDQEADLPCEPSSEQSSGNHLDTPGLIRRAMTALPYIRRGSQYAFSDICNSPGPEDDLHGDRATPMSLPCNMRSHRTNSMFSRIPGGANWKKGSSLKTGAFEDKGYVQNDGFSSIQSLGLASSYLKRNSGCCSSVFTDSLSGDSGVLSSCNKDQRVAEYLKNEHEDNVFPLRCNSMYSSRVGPSKWKKCNRKGSLEYKRPNWNLPLFRSDSITSMQTITMSPPMRSQRSVVCRPLSPTREDALHSNVTNKNPISLEFKRPNWNLFHSGSITSMQTIAMSPPLRIRRSVICRQLSPTREDALQSNSAFKNKDPISTENQNVEAETEEKPPEPNSPPPVHRQRFFSDDSDKVVVDVSRCTPANIDSLNLRPSTLQIPIENTHENPLRTSPSSQRTGNAIMLPCNYDGENLDRNMIPGVLDDTWDSRNDTWNSLTTPSPLCMSNFNSSIPSTPSVFTPGFSMSSEFSFLQKRRQKMKRATLKPLLEIVLVLFLLVPDFALKSLVASDNNPNLFALVPFTETLALVLFAIIPFLYVVSNGKIMHAL